MTKEGNLKLLTQSTDHLLFFSSGLEHRLQLLSSIENIKGALLNSNSSKAPYFILYSKIVNHLTHEYTLGPIPPLQQSQYSLRRRGVIGRIRARTEKFQSSFYPHCFSEWNELDPEIRLAPSIAVCKRKLLSKMRPLPKSFFGIHDSRGSSHLTQLRVGLSKLNSHKFQHNFRHTINPMCLSNDGIEETEHFLWLCPSLDTQRPDLLAGVQSSRISSTVWTH